MRELFASGQAAELILAFLAAEALLAALLLRRDPVRLTRLVPTLVAGALLVLALRGALVGADWPWIALALAGACLAHLADLGLRLGGDSRSRGVGQTARDARRKEASS